MVQETCPERRGQIQLICEVRLGTVGSELVAGHHHRTERRSDRIRRSRAGDVKLRLGDLHGAGVVRIARLVAESQMAVEIVLGLDGRDVVVGSQEIALLKAVVVIAIHGRGAVIQPRNAVVRRVVRVLMEVAERRAGRGTDAERERGRDAKSAVLRNIAAGDVSFIAHHIHPKGGVLA